MDDDPITAPAAQEGSELQNARRALARVEHLRDKQTEELSRLYYQLCADGWRAHIAKLEQAQQS